MRRAARPAYARSKYRNIRTTVDGIKFASKKEARRYAELALLQKAGRIHNLFCQRPFPLAVNGVALGKYVADFTYSEVPSGRYVVEDVKGFRTPIYRLKAKLMLALHGVKISET